MTHRFESQIGIKLTCCRLPMKLAGNLSLREAGARNTTLGYECTKCFRRVSVVDEWPHADAPAIYENDQEP